MILQILQTSLLEIQDLRAEEGEELTMNSPITSPHSDPAVSRSYLRKWCGGDIGGGQAHGRVPDVRDIVDWSYYKERLGSAIQKIITIPAAMQGLPNPVPRVRHPDWLAKKVAALNDKCQQLSFKETLARMARIQEEKGRMQQGLDEEGDDDDEEIEGEGEGGEDVEMMDMEDVVMDPAHPKIKKKKKSADLLPRGGLKNPSGGGGLKNPSGGLPPTSHEPPPALNNTKEAPAPSPAPDPVPKLLKPSITEDYPGWINFQRSRWRLARSERKRRRQEEDRHPRAKGGGGGGGALMPGGGLGGLGGLKGDVGALIRHKAQEVTSVPWQVRRRERKGRGLP